MAMRGWLWLFLAVASHLAALAAERPTIRVAIEPNWPPMEYLDADGAMIGYSVDYLDAVAREAGFSVKRVNVAWKDIFEGLSEGKYDMIASSVSITGEREAVMAFSDPYYQVQQVVVTDFGTVVREERDLEGMRLGAQVGTTGSFAARAVRNSTVHVYPNIAEALSVLAEGGLDGVVCDDPVAANHILENLDGESRMKVAIFIPMGEPEYFGFAVRKDDAQLLEAVNRGIARVRERGIEEKLRRKWIGY